MAAKSARCTSTFVMSGLSRSARGWLALQGDQHEQTAQDRLVYRDEEESAKARRVGLWNDAKPVPPSEWRKTTRDVMPRQL